MDTVYGHTVPVSGRLALAPGWTNAYISPPVPFLDGGRDRDGWDCWGLLRFVYQYEFGIELPEYTGAYETVDDRPGVLAVFDEQARQWQCVDEPEPGDAVWCSVAGHECHVGVYADRGTMLHVLPKRGTVIERITGPAWQNRIRNYYRHRQARFTLSP